VINIPKGDLKYKASGLIFSAVCANAFIFASDNSVGIGEVAILGSVLWAPMAAGLVAPPACPTKGYVAPFFLSGLVAIGYDIP